jgi:type I restriction enzyme M protein
VQLIDATSWFTPLRKNLGKKNCELSPADIDRIIKTFLTFDGAGDPDHSASEVAVSEHSKVFDNAEFGYSKVVVERPLRLVGVDAGRLHTAAEIRQLREMAKRDENAPPIIKKVHRIGVAADSMLGRFETEVGGKTRVVEYEPDTDLRDSEQIPLTERAGEWRDGIEAFIRREVLPYVPDAWVDETKTKIGYEISFTRHFYQPVPLRTLDEIRADIRALEAETDTLLTDILG